MRWHIQAAAQRFLQTGGEIRQLPARQPSHIKVNSRYRAFEENHPNSKQCPKCKKFWPRHRFFRYNGARDARGHQRLTKHCQKCRQARYHVKGKREGST